MRRTIGCAAAAVLLTLLPVRPVAATGQATEASARSSESLTLAVYGDSPYGTSPTDSAQLDATPAFIDSINADPNVGLVLHIGDIHSGKQYCTQGYDQAVASLWTRYQDPLVYTPGDNEWVDCNKAAEGGGKFNAATGQIDYVLDSKGNPVDYAKGDPIANLDLLRSIYFPTPGTTLGGRKRQVTSQALTSDPAHPADAKYVENVMWEQSKVMFATINLPGGSNNDDDVWYGAPTKTPAQAKEVEERTGADLRWLDAVFARAAADHVEAVIIGAQADMWDNEKGPAHQAGYEPFVKSVAEHTAAFAKPVLMINGDSHEYRSDNPLAAADPLNFVHPGYDVPNFHRIVVHGSTFPLEWLRLTIDPAAGSRPSATTFGPFSWERVQTRPDLTPVPAANSRVQGFSPPDVLSPELEKVTVAQGSMRLENGTAAVPYYGYNGNGPMVPLPSAPTVEATKTEPDKNTYLVLTGQRGADPTYDYGTHFLFQGHELGSPGFITRINLDADSAHRITLLATAETGGTPLPTFDGSTWDPWAQRLLFTAERGASGGVWQATLDVPSSVEDISGSLGRGGYEGIQNDSDGNLTIIEDVGGATDATGAKKPNSFVYRFKPDDPRDLHKGKLQVLQLGSLLNPGQPFVADTFSADQKDLHTYGRAFPTSWVTIHDTAVDGTTPFDANALAKAKGGTPFKRPENSQFRPGTGFRELYLDETGDTNATSAANAEYGGWGSVLRLTQAGPSADRGELTMLYRGDQSHTGFDNLTFLGRDELAVVEDAGDSLHAQRNALDSGFVLNVGHPYATGIQPARFLAQGRDPSATMDSAIREITPAVPFKNDGDNEITGLHTSDGDPGMVGILGARVPVRPFDPSSAWRTFFTGQHGDNVTSRIIGNRALSSRAGYWMLDAAGTVYPFGDAKSLGNGPPGAVDLEPTPSRLGYWVVTSKGSVSVHGDAQHFGDTPALLPGERVSSIASPPDGGGYWLFTSRGRVFAYGLAPHLGDLAGTALAGPVLDSTATPSGRGYYMVAEDGGIFAFGDAIFAGSTGGTHLNAPVMSLAPDPDGRGYWLVASDGGVFAFDAPFMGSLGSVRLNRPISGMIASGHGYLLVAEDGGVFAYGPGTSFLGSLGASPPPSPVIAIAAV